MVTIARPSPARRAAAGFALLVALALTAAACGDSSDEQVAATPGESAAKDPDAAGGKSPNAKDGSGPGRDGGEGGAAGGSSEGEADSGGKKATRKAIEEIPPEDRQDFAETAALSVLKSLGIPNVDIGVSDDGYTVTVGIPQQHACGVTPPQIQKVKEALKQVIISARRFRVKVQYAGPLAAYVRKNCPKLQIPSANGPLVYSQSGVGTHGSEEFKIRSHRFVVAYENAGGELKIYVAKGEDVLEPAIESNLHETGKQTYRGPGTFRVVTYGPGRWKIRVYDGV